MCITLFQLLTLMASVSLRRISKSRSIFWIRGKTWIQMLWKTYRERHVKRRCRALTSIVIGALTGASPKQPKSALMLTTKSTSALRHAVSAIVDQSHSLSQSQGPLETSWRIIRTRLSSSTTSIPMEICGSILSTVAIQTTLPRGHPRLYLLSRT